MGNFQVLNWLTCSQDLSPPTENIWSIVNRKKRNKDYKKGPRIVEQLWSHIRQGWHNIPSRSAAAALLSSQTHGVLLGEGEHCSNVVFKLKMTFFLFPLFRILFLTFNIWCFPCSVFKYESMRHVNYCLVFIYIFMQGPNYFAIGVLFLIFWFYFI